MAEQVNSGYDFKSFMWDVARFSLATGVGAVAYQGTKWFLSPNSLEMPAKLTQVTRLSPEQFQWIAAGSTFGLTLFSAERYAKGKEIKATKSDTTAARRERDENARQLAAAQAEVAAANAQNVRQEEAIAELQARADRIDELRGHLDVVEARLGMTIATNLRQQLGERNEVQQQMNAIQTQLTNQRRVMAAIFTKIAKPAPATAKQPGTTNPKPKPAVRLNGGATTTTTTTTTTSRQPNTSRQPKPPAIPPQSNAPATPLDSEKTELPSPFQNGHVSLPNGGEKKPPKVSLPNGKPVGKKFAPLDIDLKDYSPEQLKKRQASLAKSRRKPNLSFLGDITKLGNGNASDEDLTKSSLRRAHGLRSAPEVNRDRKPAEDDLQSVLSSTLNRRRQDLSESRQGPNKTDEESDWEEIDSEQGNSRLAKSVNRGGSSGSATIG